MGCGCKKNKKIDDFILSGESTFTFKKIKELVMLIPFLVIISPFLLIIIWVISIKSVLEKDFNLIDSAINMYSKYVNRNNDENTTYDVNDNLSIDDYELIDVDVK